MRFISTVLEFIGYNYLSGTLYLVPSTRQSQVEAIKLSFCRSFSHFRSKEINWVDSPAIEGKVGILTHRPNPPTNFMHFAPVSLQEKEWKQWYGPRPLGRGFAPLMTQQIRRETPESSAAETAPLFVVMMVSFR